MYLNFNHKFISFIIPFIIGLITSFSLPPYNLLIINFISFPILFIYFVNNHKDSKWMSFKIGWIYGFGYFISNIYWINNALTFDEQFKILIPISFIIIPLFLGLFYGFATLICFFFNVKKNFSSILVFAVSFSIIEFIRGSIFTGFPWNLNAYSWVQYIDFLQILSLIGTYSFNLLSITVFLIPSIFFFNISLKVKIFYISFTIILLSINYFNGKMIIKNYNQENNKLLDTKIKIISPKIDINRFLYTEEPSKIIIELIKLSNPDDKKKTIFIFPEAILNINSDQLINYKHIFSDNFSENHKILMGINSVEYRNEKKLVYNSLIVIDNNANILTKYNKNNLVPFGEFLPFENVLHKLGLKKITPGYQSFSPDYYREILKINNLKFLPLICYEIIYSGELNKKHQDYDFIINISEDGWFGNSIGPHQHFAHSIFRSIEEGKNLIRSTNNGVTAFINSKGQIINKIESTQKGVIELNNFKPNKRTIFSIHGNKLFFYFILFYITLIFFLKKKKQGS